MTDDDTTIELPVSPSPAETEPGSWPSRRADCPIASSAHEADRHPVTVGHPQPAMQLVSKSQFTQQMGHPPNRQDKVGITPEARMWLNKQARREHRTQPDEPTVSAMRKVMKLLNGKPVPGHAEQTFHRLFTESPPTLDELLSDSEVAAVDPIDSKPTPTGMHQDDVEAAFGGLPWFERAEPNPHTLLDERFVAGLKRRLHLTPRGKHWVEHIAAASDFSIPVPQFEGGLVHRYGVGLLVLFELLHGASKVWAYHELDTGDGTDNVDILGVHSDGEGYQIVGEVIGRHNNRTWDTQTFVKTRRLSERGYIPLYVFADLDRAKTAIRRWIRDGHLTLDRKIDNLDAERLRRLLEELYRDDPTCGIRAFWTVRELRDRVFEQSPSMALIDSLDWKMDGTPVIADA